MVAVFSLLVEPGESRSVRASWLRAAVLSTAMGPAFGGPVTQVLSWEWIFVAQAPIAAAAAVLLALRFPSIPTAAGAIAAMQLDPDETAGRRRVGHAIALALVSGALTAVLFLLVLLLVVGWAVEPLRAAVTVTVLPLAAAAGARIRGEARARAATGCLLIGAGTVALAFLPTAGLAWTVAPQVLAGVGTGGWALPALGGKLLPERTANDAAWQLAIRHAGIAVALVLLAPITADRLETGTQGARERGVALVLDAKLSPTRKLELAPAMMRGVNEDRPRAGLESAATKVRDGVDDDGERAALAGLGQQADDALVAAVGESFFVALLLAGGLALVASLGVLPRSGGLPGFLQDRGLELLDRTACDLGSSREELVLALTSDADRARFIERRGKDPRSVADLLTSLTG